MGQAAQKMCRTQEIAFEPGGAEEWQAVDEWSEDKAVPPSALEAPISNCHPCCVPGDSKVEEVLVVHHEALQKIDYLLRHDELLACESPSVPRCVMAMRRAKIQKRIQGAQKKKLLTERTQRSNIADGNPSDDELSGTLGTTCFDGDENSFDAFLGKLHHTGIPMRALLPNQGSNVVTEDVTLQLLPNDRNLHDAPVALDGIDGPPKHAFSLRGVAKVRQLYLPLSSIMCCVCIGPTSNDDRGHTPTARESEDDGSAGDKTASIVKGANDAESSLVYLTIMWNGERISQHESMILQANGGGVAVERKIYAGVVSLGESTSVDPKQNVTGAATSTQANGIEMVGDGGAMATWGGSVYSADESRDTFNAESTSFTDDAVSSDDVDALQPHHLLFLNAKDAEDFHSWMKYFHGTQVVCVQDRIL
eukprot:TRINITY_DN9641_c0_g1_i1.p1 TRINITY_DN9641_c0_g1~~TRINITY_DN9641_c0_g1_i1.p1  ORF type:complete len:421 (-),score=73.08 TRINITY_DN9641_c0_g1_i1:615-1877(-)